MNTHSPTPTPDRATDYQTAEEIFAAWAAMELAYVKAGLDARRHGFFSSHAIDALGRARQLEEVLFAILAPQGDR